MATLPYRDLAEIHDPSTGGFVPAAWGKQNRINEQLLAEKPRVLLRGTTTSISLDDPVNPEWTNVELDTHNAFRRSQPTRIIAPFDGIWLVEAHIALPYNSTGLCGLSIFRSGIKRAGWATQTANGAPVIRFSATAIENVRAGDFFSVACYQNLALGIPIFADSNESFFSAEWLGRFQS